MAKANEPGTALLLMVSWIFRNSSQKPFDGIEIAL
jgi:hypothetical protein